MTRLDERGPTWWRKLVHPRLGHLWVRYQWTELTGPPGDQISGPKNTVYQCAYSWCRHHVDAMFASGPEIPTEFDTMEDGVKPPGWRD